MRQVNAQAPPSARPGGTQFFALPAACASRSGEGGYRSPADFGSAFASAATECAGGKPGADMNAAAGEICYTTGMVKTLELAMSKAAALPEAAQEQLGRELLEHIETLSELRAEIEIGIKELDAGKGEELDIEDVIREARNEHGRRG